MPAGSSCSYSRLISSCNCLSWTFLISNHIWSVIYSWTIFVLQSQVHKTLSHRRIKSKTWLSEEDKHQRKVSMQVYFILILLPSKLKLSDFTSEAFCRPLQQELLDTWWLLTKCFRKLFILRCSWTKFENTLNQASYHHYCHNDRFFTGKWSLFVYFAIILPNSR